MFHTFLFVLNKVSYKVHNQKKNGTGTKFDFLLFMMTLYITGSNPVFGGINDTLRPFVLLCHYELAVMLIEIGRISLS